ncbi:hypothetical protein NUU61_000157 [Penicillium alfredii]|uniref:Aflatoxin regulatory protein domain-containing protein n=1 Tax=Penicillium alfredii TaxID=1506179 RepID=A0A9W9G973_9EURO|nr:uncharacterized protein NUU61_000157 [Penicillium alfredii]KAJ5114398.1 hypothetical protein NUU61_000157 [Penicillium alfredii]
MPVDLTGDIFSATGSGGTTADSAPTNDQMDPWCEKTFHQALEEFDWVFPEPAMGLDRLVDPNHNDLDFLSHPTGVPTPSGSSNDSANSAPLSNSGNTQHPTSHSAPNCPCRANIMLHVPKIESAIQEKPKPRLDDMFKVTGDVIRSCLESTRCGCRLGPVDLVCIMTVFEQTAVCFDYIAKSGFDGTVKVGIGNYCVSLKDDASLKRTLVLDLVSQANVFLDSLSALAQKMIALQNEPGVKCMGRSPACLTQLNFNYLREATASFKRLFRLMTEFFEGEHSDTRIQAGDYRSSVANS